MTEHQDDLITIGFPVTVTVNHVRRADWPLVRQALIAKLQRAVQEAIGESNVTLGCAHD